MRVGSVKGLGKDEVAMMLVRLLEAYTPPGSEAKLHGILRDMCSGLSFEECRVDGVGNFLASYGDGETVILASHLDTIPGRLEVSYDGELVKGRGAVDAKGPLLSYILGASMAMKHVRDLKVVVAGLVREELDGAGARHLVEAGVRADHVLVGEPTNLGIAIAYRGSITVEARSSARGGHSSAPYIGESALDRMLDFLSEFRSKFRGTSYEQVTSAITMLSSGDWPSKLPEEARAHLNIRFPSSQDHGRLLEELRELAEKRGIELRIIDVTQPVEASLSAPIIRALIRGCIRAGLRPRIVKKTGTSDMNILVRLTGSIAAFGPGDSRLAHTSYEAISVQEIIRAAEIVSATLRELAGVRRS
ncbi:MAG: M20/M25/M40 family metallo-hydrolase [Nitrososphaerota archaeon]